MTVFRCVRCNLKHTGVRLVEHGTDDMPLCKECFNSLKREFDNRPESEQ
jgi:hypothetical protein